MALITYIGDHAGVVVPVTATHSVEAKWGEPVEMPAEIAESLLESAAWKKADKASKKDAAAAAPVNDNTVDSVDGEKE